MTAHRGLGKEEIIGGSGKTLKGSHPAEGFEMTEIDDEGLLLHHGSNNNTLILKSKGKIDLDLKFNSYGARKRIYQTSDEDFLVDWNEGDAEPILSQAQHKVQDDN
jgi:hypothetical protein